jgi:hypothetical protein
VFVPGVLLEEQCRFIYKLCWCNNLPGQVLFDAFVDILAHDGQLVRYGVFVDCRDRGIAEKALG